MKRIGSVLFKPSGPLMFRGPMEFTPTIRGPQTFARTLPLPLPSTIAGCLATLLLDKGVASLPKISLSWEDALIQVLGLDDKAYLRGPYLLVDNEVYIPFEEGVIKLHDLFEKFKETNIEEIIYKDEFFKNLELIMIPLKKVEHVGIGLDKATKAVKRGLLYSVEFVDYLSTFKGHEVSIAIDVHGASALNKLLPQEQYVMRLGGEGKTVQIKINETSYLWKVVSEPIRKMSFKEECLMYMISPTLIKTPLTNLTPVISTRRPKFFISGINVELLAGRVNVLGAGFDVRREIKKPMYASLTHGSLLKTKIKQIDLTKLYQYGLSDMGGKLGYGTFIPLPID